MKIGITFASYSSSVQHFGRKYTGFQVYNSATKLKAKLSKEQYSTTIFFLGGYGSIFKTFPRNEYFLYSPNHFLSPFKKIGQCGDYSSDPIFAVIHSFIWGLAFLATSGDGSIQELYGFGAWSQPL